MLTDCGVAFYCGNSLAFLSIFVFDCLMFAPKFKWALLGQNSHHYQFALSTLKNAYHITHYSNLFKKSQQQKYQLTIHLPLNFIYNRETTKSVFSQHIIDDFFFLKNFEVLPCSVTLPTMSVSLFQLCSGSHGLPL